MNCLCCAPDADRVAKMNCAKDLFRRFLNALIGVFQRLIFRLASVDFKQKTLSEKCSACSIYKSKPSRPR